MTGGESECNLHSSATGSRSNASAGTLSSSAALWSRGAFNTLASVKNSSDACWLCFWVNAVPSAAVMEHSCQLVREVQRHHRKGTQEQVLARAAFRAGRRTRRLPPSNQENGKRGRSRQQPWKIQATSMKTSRTIGSHSRKFCRRVKMHKRSMPWSGDTATTA